MAVQDISPRRAGVAVILACLFTQGLSARADDSGQRFAAGFPGAAAFGQTPGLSCPRSGTATALAIELKRISDNAKAPEAKEDGRLCAAAQVLLSWDPAAGETPPPQVVAFVSANAGLPTPAKRILVTNLAINVIASEGHTLQTEEEKAVAQALRQTVGETLINYQQPRWGMAYQRVKKGSYKVAVVMDDRVLELDPLPRKLSAGQAVPLSGRVLLPYKNPKVTLSDARGMVTKQDGIPGDAFKGELKCGATPGDLWVEVQADRDGHAVTAAAFSVACGKDLPSAVALSSMAWPKDAPGQEHRLADGINTEREAAGVGRVEWDDKLSSVARTVAETIRDQVGRGESPAVDLGQLFEKAGVASALVLQNPAQARSAEEAEQRFTASPSNRQNILNPEVNRVGVGIASAQDASGKPTVFVVELFTKVLAHVDLAALKRDLYAAIEKRRAEASAVKAAIDPKLENVAQDYAVATAQAAGKLSDDDASEITHGIRIAYKSIDMVDGAKVDPLAFAEDQAVLSPGTSIGIGLAQGDHPVLGKNAVYVAIILATARTADTTPGAKPPTTPTKPAPKPAAKKAQ